MRLLKWHGYDSRTGAPHTKQNAMLQPEGAIDVEEQAEVNRVSWSHGKCNP